MNERPPTSFDAWPETVSLRLAPDLLRQIDAIARENGTTRSAVIVAALRKHLDADAPPARPIF